MLMARTRVACGIGVASCLVFASWSSGQQEAVIADVLAAETPYDSGLASRGCELVWDHRFSRPAVTGALSEPWDIARLDRQDGSTVYFAGEFDTAGGIEGDQVGEWNGTSLRPLPGLSEPMVQAVATSIATANLEGLNQLFVARPFGLGLETDPGAAFARWDGRHWTVLESSIFEDESGVAGSLYLADSVDCGDREYVYATGKIGGFSPGREVVARWDGESWQTLWDESNADEPRPVLDERFGVLCRRVDGDRQLIAGPFSTVRFTDGPFVFARWDGNGWIPVGDELSQLPRVIVEYNDGAGATLYTATRFGRILRLEGELWAELPPPAPNSDIFDLVVAGPRPSLMALGAFDGGPPGEGGILAGWDGTAWEAIPSNTSCPGTPQAPAVRAIAETDRADAPLVVTGRFLDIDVADCVLGVTTGGQRAAGTARWDGNHWSRLGIGFVEQFLVQDIEVHGPRGGSRAYVATRIESRPGPNIHGVVRRWEGTGWGDVGDLGRVIPSRLLSVPGTDELLVAGELLDPATGAFQTGTVASWDGDAWSDLSQETIDGRVTAIASARTTSGPLSGARAEDSVFIGGDFRTIGGQPAVQVAEWDGEHWYPLESGFPAPSILVHSMLASAATGSLVLGGRFQPGTGDPMRNIAEWDGSQWVAMGNGLPGSVFGLADFDDGSGLALHAVGEFGPRVLLYPGDPIAKWDGAEWTIVPGSPILNGRSLQVVPVGNREVLLVGGSERASSDFIFRIRPAFRAWDGQQWFEIAPGLEGERTPFGSQVGVTSIAFNPRGDSGDLWLGGGMLEAGAQPSFGIARRYVPGLPTIVVDPVSADAKPGDRAELRIEAEGDSLTYQWLRDGTPILSDAEPSFQGATSSTLSIEPVLPRDASAYSCVVASCCGAVESVTAQLNVDVPPFCLGDASHDARVNLRDLVSVLINWRLGEAGFGPRFDDEGRLFGDANGDYQITFADILAVLENWRAPCD